MLGWEPSVSYRQTHMEAGHRGEAAGGESLNATQMWLGGQDPILRWEGTPGSVRHQSPAPGLGHALLGMGG